VEGGERWARWSFLGWDAAFTLRSREGVSTVEGPVRVEVPGGDPLQVLEELVGRYTTPDLPGLPPLHSGAVGYLGYDVVRYVENLPHRPPDDRGLPEQVWQFVGALAAMDRFSHSIVLIRNVFVGDDPEAQYHEAVAALRTDIARLGEPSRYEARPLTGESPEVPFTSNFRRETFEHAVEVAKEHIVAGDAFQIVISQRFAADFDGDPFAIYRALRLINPSPFLFFVRDPEVAVIGASPEIMTRVRDGVAYSRPIAGTRPRGSPRRKIAGWKGSCWRIRRSGPNT
jgi:anthranilate synthase component I